MLTYLLNSTAAANAVRCEARESSKKRNIRSGWQAGVFLILLLIPLGSKADTAYNAALGTLPQAQQFVYSGDDGNASPFLSGGALHVSKTLPNTFLEWKETDSGTSFANMFTMEASIAVTSSNFVSNVGDGSSREGYYLFAADDTGRAYSVGITSTGVVLNDYPSGTVIPYSLSNGFHTYDLSVKNDLASLSIDGVIVVSGVAPEPAGLQGVTDITAFGPLAGASMSNTALDWFCSSDSGANCGAGLQVSTPEPNSLWISLLGLAALGAAFRIRVG